MGINGLNLAPTTSINQHIDSSEKNKFEWVQNTGSIALAWGGSYGVKKLSQKLENKFAIDLIKEGSFSSMILNGKKAREIFKASGLAEKGVKLQDIHYSNPKKSCQAKFTKKFFKNIKEKQFSQIKKDFIDLILEQSKNQAAMGVNALFDPRKKTISNNLKAYGMALPHEMGHALNYTSKNPLFKILTKSKGLTVLAPLIFATTVLRKPKKEGEKSDTFIGKTLDFIKENCTALTAGCFAPMLIEEGLASYRGAKIAKTFLVQKKMKAINTLNFRGWLTYAVLAGASIASVYVADKIRNLTAPKTSDYNLVTDNKEQNKQNNLQKEVEAKEYIA